ncbi:MAG: hypothetical protein ACK506_16175 [Pirellula sp.]
MGSIGDCCCNCLCPGAFSLIGASYNWLGQAFAPVFPGGTPGPEVCSRLVTQCIADSTWSLYHDEVAIGPWVSRSLIQTGSPDCGCLGTYNRRSIQIDDRLIRRFKMWRKRRLTTSLFVQDCGPSQLRFVVQATVQYLWIWNATLKTRNRYTISTRSCPMNTVITDPTVSLGDDTGHDPPFPPFADDYPASLGCVAETWTPADTCNTDTRAIVSITGRNNSCFDETRNANLGVVTSCTNCAEILFPNPDRTVSSSALVTYESNCIPCDAIPATVELAIPGATGDVSFSIYGSAFTTGLCSWLTTFPASPTLTIPRLLSLTPTM